ncbi:MAG: thioredoxin family protein [Chitinophagales bacterium]|nr:thioredoxin family protein [Chitinophagales bacterium]MDW8273751.1 thioredoxin family protein [Chitinophagales bacterium]
MALTPSNMLPLGTKAPYFKLPDAASGKIISYNDIKGKYGTLIVFICNHCPYVKHINKQFSAVASQYIHKGIGIAAISSNDVERYPEDAPEKMKEVAMAENYCFPYLYDETQEVARAYDAACTPDFYLFDAQDMLVYRGQFDDSRPGNNVPVTGKDLVAAMDALIEGRPISPIQRPSTGCNIKWKNA